MIVLIRHAEAADARGRYIGRTDLPLSEDGTAQANNLARTLPDLLSGARSGALFTSPLGRSRQTAAPLAASLGLTPVVLDDLAEIDLGQWDGLSMDDVRHSQPEAHAARGRDFAGFRPPGGENFRDVQTRALHALQTMVDAPAPAIAVTHAGIIRAVACHMLGMPLDNLFRLRPAHCRAMILTPRDGGYRMDAFNALGT